MTLYHDSIRSVLTEIEKFLVETIKKVQLKKPQEEHKQLILTKVANLRQEYPALLPDNKGDSKSSQDSSKEGSGGTIESANSVDHDDGASENIDLKPAVELKNPECCGFLEKKQKKGKLTGKSTFQKRWCVINNRIFYYYEGKKDKKQNGAFSLEGYVFKEAPELVKDSGKKKLWGFELECKNKRTYEFVASTKDEFEMWKGAVSPIEEDIYDCVEQDDKVKPVDDSYEIADENETASGGSKGSVERDVKPEPSALNKMPKARAPPPVEPSRDSTYEDTDSNKQPLRPPPKVPPLSLKKLQEPEDNYDVGFTPKAVSNDTVAKDTDDGEVYDEGFTVPEAKPAVELKGSGEGLIQDEIYEDLEDFAKDNPGNESNRVSVKKTFREPPPPPVSEIPDAKQHGDYGRRPPNLAPPSIPPPVTPKKALPKKDPPKLKINKPSEDFENLYYGMWDCIADNANELSFKQGDIIHIINRELDARSWWVGEMNGSYGLVPKNYLTPAYEEVAA